MKYELASSSTEELTKPEKNGFSIPYADSHLRYYYYPTTANFIGENTVPRPANYMASNVCAKLKKELKADYPYIAFNLLANGKDFFSNSFAFVKDCVEDKSKAEVKLKAERGNLKEIPKLDVATKDTKLYNKFYKEALFQDVNDAPATTKKIVAISDRMLKHASNPKAFIFFMVTSVQKTAKRTITKYTFEDVYFSKASFYEYLEIFNDHLLASQNSEEVRTFSKGTTQILVHSSTTFTMDGGKKYFYNGLGNVKNMDILCNKGTPAIVESTGYEQDNLWIFTGMDLPDGDYVLNDRKIYKPGKEGMQVKLEEEIDYADFFQPFNGNAQTTRNYWMQSAMTLLITTLIVYLVPLGMPLAILD